MTTHAKCAKTWTGLRTQHCPACCATFTGESTGDRHRVGDHNELTGPHRRRCLTAEEMTARGLVLDSRGIWGTAEWTPRVTPKARAERASGGDPVVTVTPRTTDAAAVGDPVSVQPHCPECGRNPCACADPCACGHEQRTHFRNTNTCMHSTPTETWACPCMEYRTPART